LKNKFYKIKIKRKLFILIFIIFLSSFVSAVELGVSPGRIEFFGECENVTIFATGKIIAEDKWSKINSNNLDDYNLNSRNAGVEIKYEKNFIVNGNKKIPVCIEGEGEHFGVLLFRQEGSMAGVGSWLYVDINNKNEIRKEIFMLVPVTFELVLLLFLLRKL